jgi:hypothetical protein
MLVPATSARIRRREALRVLPGDDPEAAVADVPTTIPMDADGSSLYNQHSLVIE